MTHCEPTRDRSKSPEHDLAGRLSHEVGLNLAQIRATLDIVGEHLQTYHSQLRAPGVITHTAVSAKEPAGKPIKLCKIVPVTLTLFDPADLDVIRQQGSVELRKTRIFRWTHEARSMGGLLSYEDLHALLGVDLSTIQDLVRQMRNQGLFVPTRGFVKDIGPEPTHKSLIADLLGRGFSTSQIRALTKHSEGAIGRYQYQFALVLHLLHSFPQASDDQRCCLSGLSPKAYQAYLEVYQNLKDRDDCSPHLERLRLRFLLDPDDSAHQTPADAKAFKNLAHDRLEKQTLENAIRQKVQQDLGTTPKVAQIVTGDLVDLIHACYHLPEELRPGEVLTFLDTYDPFLVSGDRYADRPLVPVRIPVLTEQTLSIWRSDQPIALRRARLACLFASTAIEQGGIMTLAKLAEILHIEPSTLSSNLRQLAADFFEHAATKGLLEDAGPTLTHKSWIVDLDQHGFTAQEISWLTRHAASSRDRYIETYRRAETLMRLNGRIPDASDLARLFSLRAHVAQQYVDLLRRYHPDGIPSDGISPLSPSPVVTSVSDPDQTEQRS